MRHWCKISNLKLAPVSNYWTWTKATPQKKCFFRSNLYKIEAMITSLIQMLQLPNFGHMTTSTLQFESREKILLVTSLTEIETSSLLFQKNFNLRPTVAIFADIIKIVTIFTKTIFKDSKNIETSRNFISKWDLYMHFLI